MQASDLSWERVPQPLPNLVGFGAVLPAGTVVVQYDRLHPDYGWSASYKLSDFSMVMLEEQFGTKKAAQRAALEALMQELH